MKTSHRLSSADFRKLRPARRLSGELFSLSTTPLPTVHPKWACVVSKKVSAKAVKRNLVKRRCRSVLAKELKNFREPVALVFLAKRGAAEASFAETERDIKKLLARLG